MRPETPFRLLVLGDFSGRREGAAASFGPVRPVDRDDLDALFSRLAPSVRLTESGGAAAGLEIEFGELDDLHPDRLLLRVDALQRLRDLRARLRSRTDFEEAAAEVRALLGDPESGEPESEPSAAAHVEPEPGPSVEDLLGHAIHATDELASAGEQDWDGFVRDLVAPHMERYRVARTTPEQKDLVAAVEAALATGLRRILADPAFQRVESAWRALDRLVRRTETSTRLQIHLLDVSRDELAADLGSTGDLRATRLFRLLVEPSVEIAGGEPWAALIGDYVFDAVPRDVLLLSKLGRLAGAAGASFVAGAASTLFGCRSLGETPHVADWKDAGDPLGPLLWDKFRATEAARHVALVWPRFLQRLPYGPETDPAEAFAFDEMPGKPVHDHYLWGNAAFVAAHALTQRFLAEDWDMQPGRTFDFDRLPVHVHRDDEGAQVASPCGEALLTERAVETVQAQGVVPLLSIRGTDGVRLGRLHSLAGAEVPLAGPWR